jgi:polyisoprenoid-binding protein YceI
MRCGKEQATTGVVGSPFAPVVVAIAALIAALARWQLQGSGNVYTAVSKRFYVPDPDIGLRISKEHPIWLGLEICAVIAAIAIGLAIGAWIIRWREARRGRRSTILRVLSWIVAVVPLIVPIVAFASGSRPVGGLDTRPTDRAGEVAGGIAGTIDAPEGRYEVVAHAGTSITAHLSAGGEVFDAQLSGGVRGGWQGDPRDLTQPMVAEVSVDAASIDTGIDERSKHAREEYLHVGQFPRIAVTVDRLLAANQAGGNAIGFRARGTLKLIGKTHAVEITGTLRKPDAAALTRLGLSGEILLVQADLAVVIKETALAPDAGDFDGERIPIHVSLVMRHTSG